MIGFLMRNIFFRNLVSPLTDIELIKNGFSIHSPFSWKRQRFYWNEINDVRFSSDNTQLILNTKRKIKTLNNDNIGWYELIQSIPENYSNFDYEYVKSFMGSLKPCGVCGIIAVRKNECIVCESIVWNNGMSDSQNEYLKSKQSDLYSDNLKEGIEIKKVAEPEHGFKADKNWTLYIKTTANKTYE
jgi:hypothetical protein